MDTSYSPAPGEPTIQCVGRYGKSCGLPSTVTGTVGGITPENHWNQRTTLSIGDVDLSYRWRHISGSVVDSGHTGDPSDRIGNFDYIDLAGVWHVTDQTQFTLSINNVAEREAPFVVTQTGSTVFNSGNTYPSTYDVLGRVISLGVSARF